MLRAFPSTVIENLQPLVDDGHYPIKRIIGEDLVVEADIFKDGHDVVAAVLKWRVLGKRQWREKPLAVVDKDPRRGVCTLFDNAIFEKTIQGGAGRVFWWGGEVGPQIKAGLSVLPGH